MRGLKTEGTASVVVRGARVGPAPARWPLRVGGRRPTRLWAGHRIRRTRVGSLISPCPGLRSGWPAIKQRNSASWACRRWSTATAKSGSLAPSSAFAVRCRFALLAYAQDEHVHPAGRRLACAQASALGEHYAVDDPFVLVDRGVLDAAFPSEERQPQFSKPGVGSDTPVDDVPTSRVAQPRTCPTPDELGALPRFRTTVPGVTVARAGRGHAHGGARRDLRGSGNRRREQVGTAPGSRRVQEAWAFHRAVEPEPDEVDQKRSLVLLDQLRAAV